MTRKNERSSSPDSADSSTLVKRLKTSHVSLPNPSTASSKPGPAYKGHDSDWDPTSTFFPDLFDHNNIAKLHSGYVVNLPFKYAVVEKLFQDDLLRKVKEECLSELNFTEKETDIYKINQTGDLASLNYLSPSQIALLPNLLTLRDALYSSTFRAFLQTVTGCAPLSGTKQDMSVNSYTKGCHLLTHDDVIGTRCVSYILYMPLPHYQFWQKDWGGALELYPVNMTEDGEREPQVAPAKSIPPSWNQFIFFEVQPGKSFHSVEEIVVGGEGEDGRERLSISGWFHSAQEGEEGYIPKQQPQREVKSSREQLTSTSTVFAPYPESSPSPLPDSPLSEEHLAFLSEFLNPVYLQARTMKALADRFIEESSLELHSFLSNALAENLEPRLRELDAKDGLGRDRQGRIPPHSAGTNDGTGAWMVKGPPHKWRYCVLKPHEEGKPVEAVFPRAAHGSSDEILRSLQDELFPSPAFRAWLSFVSKLLPLKYSTEARRFRPGLDYTLATSEEKEARLDVVLGLTPDAQGSVTRNARAGGARQPPGAGWQAEWGGWECYMAPHNEEDDPAVYRSSTHKKSMMTATNEHTSENNGKPPSSPNPPKGDPHANGHANVPSVAGPSSPRAPSNGERPGQSPADHDGDSHMGNGNRSDDMEGVEDKDDQDAEEEDSTLLTVQPGFNRLLLVLRDERVMRFVKYVSAATEGSRWDVCAEYEIGMMQLEDSDRDGAGEDDDGEEDRYEFLEVGPGREGIEADGS